MYLHSTDSVTGYCSYSQHQHCSVWCSLYTETWFTPSPRHLCGFCKQRGISCLFFWDRVSAAEIKSDLMRFWMLWGAENCLGLSPVSEVWMSPGPTNIKGGPGTTTKPQHKKKPPNQPTKKQHTTHTQMNKMNKQPKHNSGATLSKFPEIFNSSKTLPFPLLGKYPVCTTSSNGRSWKIPL